MNSRGKFACVLAMLLAAAVGAGAQFAGAQGAAFGLFALLAVGGGAVCLFERSTVSSTFGMLTTFFGVAGLFLLLESDFLAVAQLLIFCGGIVALLLFGVALTPPVEGERRFARILFALLLLGPLCGFVAWRCHAVRAFTSERITAADGTTSSIFCGNSLGKEAVSDAGEIGVALVDSKQYVVAFEVAGLLLVVALVAALSIARRRELELEDAS